MTNPQHNQSIEEAAENSRKNWVLIHCSKALGREVTHDELARIGIGVYPHAFKAGAAHAAKDMVPADVVQGLVDTLESIAADKFDIHKPRGKHELAVIVQTDTIKAREALAEFKTWKARRG